MSNSNLGIWLRGDKNNPFHLSVGQVAEDSNGKIALIQKPDGKKTLPRETTYLLEPYDQALTRGADEELGVKVQTVRYLGALITHFDREPKVTVEKTTLYFHTKASAKTVRKLEEDEAEDTVLWISPKEALDLLSQRENPESEIVKRFLKTA